METAGKLDKLLRPRSIAVIGVSRTIDRRASVGGAAVLHNLRRFGFPGRLSVIHPEVSEISGVEAFPSLAALPDLPDLVSVAVPAKRLVSIVDECGSRGIKAMTIHTAGFGELGTEAGLALEATLRKAAMAHGIQICGPNGLGFINLSERIFAGNFPSLESIAPKAGRLAILTQSGAIGGSLIARAHDRSVGLSFVISSGNETTVAMADYIDFLVSDPGTGCIAVYLEGVHDGAKFVRALRNAREAGKPIIVFKVGKTEAGAKAALSHTAKVAGSARLYAGLFRQTGVIEAEALDDLIDISSLLIKTAPMRFSKPPHGAGIVTISGGLGAIIADSLAAKSLSVPAFASSTVERLREMAIPFASIANPVDTTAAIHHNEDDIATVLEIVADDPGVDVVIVPNASRFANAASQTARRLDTIGARLTKPLISIWYAGSDNAEAIAHLRESTTVVSFEDHASCARGLAALRLRVAMTFEPGADSVVCGTQFPDRAARLTGMLSEAEAKNVLRAFDVNVPHELHAHGADAAVRAAAVIGFPVALKIVSADIVHKAAVGGVRLGLASAAEVSSAFDTMMRDVGGALPSARLDGVLISEMVSIGCELLVGLYVDATFGRALVVGSGGSFVEDINDVAICLLPATRRDCAQLLDHLEDRGLKARIKPHLDLVIDAITSIANLVSTMPDLIEMDINPLAVTRTGKVVALDAVMKFADARPLDAPDRAEATTGHSL